MKKIAYKKVKNGCLVFAIAGFIFALHPDCQGPVEAMNSNGMVFDPECIIAVDDNSLVIAQ